MNTDLMFSSKSDKWNTPPELYCSLDKEFRFELDPCPANPIVDGLKIGWNKTTYVNPPYGRGIGAWVKKAYESSLDGHTIVMLLPARTDTEWWHKYVMRAYEVRLIKGRLRFSGAKNSAPFPSAIVVFSGKTDSFPRFISIDQKGEPVYG